MATKSNSPDRSFPLGLVIGRKYSIEGGAIPFGVKARHAVLGIMWVIEDHLRPSGHIMPDHVGDRGAMRQILEPRDHLHINHERTFEAGCGHAQISQFWF
ncbi:MAG TPA: hypothetical protein VN961_13780, partial [Streptosporangiaceae bacterium]|nr:hypothetical protein [Streptosporangiaceae bacterium]